MVLRGMMFACAIGSIEDAFTPEILELVLGIPALEPMKTLIHRLGGLGRHGAHGEPECRDIVGGDWGGLGLEVTHFLECCAEWGGDFPTVVKRSLFDFRSGGHNMLDDGR